jgi:hypothetical protein
MLKGVRHGGLLQDILDAASSLGRATQMAEPIANDWMHGPEVIATRGRL